ncbi:hypothetical protein PoB_002846000 [Plakobranchus ocellatus]|uniref:Uncharacterized protein n=1 Tax=Plakobranchus ocellatus TaxID=259542 RepID=A0AAV4A3M0_9GAST|nr:hypothetical protein PoB_002846000 [Plakobranchus ocellatus]
MKKKRGTPEKKEEKEKKELGINTGEKEHTLHLVCLLQLPPYSKNLWDSKDFSKRQTTDLPLIFIVREARTKQRILIKREKKKKAVAVVFPKREDFKMLKITAEFPSVTSVLDTFSPCPQQGDLRLSGPPSGQDASGGARTRDGRVPIDLRAGWPASVPQKSPRTKY